MRINATIDIIQRMKKHHFLLVGLAVFSGFLAAPSILAQSTPATPTAMNQVPFVGCASDGQAGPLAAPTGPGKAVLAPAATPRLAWYKAQYGPGVLAPRGWHCFSIYGSDGSKLFVSSEVIDAKTLLSVDWKGFTGPAIEISVSSGGTSGRFEVAKVIARVFPAYKHFAQNVIAEGVEPASDFPSGPYATDKLADHGNNIVEFETPANTAGLGTNSRLLPNANPIYGVAIISGTDTDLTQLTVRVPAKDSDLIPLFVRQVESDAAASKQ